MEFKIKIFSKIVAWAQGISRAIALPPTDEFGFLEEALIPSMGLRQEKGVRNTRHAVMTDNHGNEFMMLMNMQPDEFAGLPGAIKARLKLEATQERPHHYRFGMGHAGEVVLGQCLLSQNPALHAGDYVAVKKIEISSGALIGEYLVGRIKKEVFLKEYHEIEMNEWLSAQCSDVSLVKYYGAAYSAGKPKEPDKQHYNFYLFMEIASPFVSGYILEGTIWQLHFHQEFTPPQIWDISKSYLREFQKLQAHGIAWREGKLENILLRKLPDGRLETLLSDFGLSCFQTNPPDDQGGNIWYRAPEIIAPKLVKHGDYGQYEPYDDNPTGMRALQVLNIPDWEKLQTCPKDWVKADWYTAGRTLQFLCTMVEISSISQIPWLAKFSRLGTEELSPDQRMWKKRFSFLKEVVANKLAADFPDQRWSLAQALDALDRFENGDRDLELQLEAVIAQQKRERDLNLKELRSGYNSIQEEACGEAPPAKAARTEE